MTDPITPPKKSIHLDIVYDTICPWSYLGLKLLKKAIDTADGIDFTYNYLPFFLIEPSDIPIEGGNFFDLVHKEYDAQQKMELFEDLKEQCESNEINIVPDVKVYPSVLSHRLVDYARQFNKDGEVLMLMYKLLFEKGGDISNVDNLVQLADLVGLDTVRAKKFLDSTLGTEELYEMAKDSEGCLEVPYIIVSNPSENIKIPFRGIIDVETWLEAFENVV